MEQRTEHFDDLKHTLTIMKKTTDEDELPFQLSTMYLLDQGALRFVKVPQVRGDRKSTRLNSSHPSRSRMPSSAWKKKEEHLTETTKKARTSEA